MRPGRIARILRGAMILVMLVAAAFPFYWMFVTSTTPLSELLTTSPRLLPTWRRLHIYKDIFATGDVPVWVVNSAIVALGNTILSIALATFGAYALSRFRFRGRGLVGFGLFATQMLPEVMLVVPLYAIFAQFGLLNSLTGLVVADASFTIPVVTWIMTRAFDAVPVEVEEAARVDGCSRLDTMLAVAVPLVAPTLAACAVISFFHGWNEYVFAQTFVSSESLHVASVGLAGFIGELTTPIHTVMAIGVIYALPGVAFYLFAQRYIVSGMAAGSVKG